MTDMTVGSPHSHLRCHALPLPGHWLQLSYNVVDTIIAGRFIGQNALAAEGIAAPDNGGGLFMSPAQHAASARPFFRSGKRSFC